MRKKKQTWYVHTPAGGWGQVVNLTGYVEPVMLSYTVSIHSKAVKAIIKEI